MKNNLSLTEDIRYKNQIKIDSEKPRSERYKFGQFSTPRKLADEILEFSKSVTDFDEVNFLDPAFGTGSFYTALMKSYGKKVKSAIGFEIDKEYYLAAKQTWENFKTLNIINSDFTQEDNSTYSKFNLLVCNPPYTRHHDIDSETKARLKQFVNEKFNTKISGLSGLHIYFMLLSHQWMAKNATSVWLIPSEIFEVNYGAIIKKYLLNNVDLLRIHFFNHSDGQFSDALVSSCVVTFKHNSPNQNNGVQISYGESLLKPSAMVSISKSELAKQKKWSKHLVTKKSDKLINSSKKEYFVGDFFDVKRGIATGDNNFFIIEKNKADLLKIPKKYLRNILPSARYIDGGAIYLDDDGFLKTEKKLVMLDIDLPLEQIEKLYPKLYEYLSEGMKSGVNIKYLTSRRKPWYSQEKRQPPEYFVRYMMRERGESSNKSILIKNNSNAVATNSYLLLYRKKQASLDNDFQDEEVWSHLIGKLNENLCHLGRTYGGGLVKFEPSELKQISFHI